MHIWLYMTKIAFFTFKNIYKTNVCSQTLLNHGILVRLEVSPGLSTCLPPYTSVAPSFTPSSQYSTSLSRWALWFWGPWSVERSKGSPIFIFLISSTWAEKNTSMPSSRSSSQAFIYNQYVRRKHAPLSWCTRHEWTPQQTAGLQQYSFLPCWSKPSSCPATSTQTHSKLKTTMIVHLWLLTLVIFSHHSHCFVHVAVAEDD